MSIPPPNYELIIDDVAPRSTKKSYLNKTWLGRTIQKIESAAHTIAKVGLVFGLCIGIGISMFAAPTTNPVQEAVSRLCRPQVPMIPKLLQHPLAATLPYMNPGLMLARAGTAACETIPYMYRPLDCEAITSNILGHYLAHTKTHEIHEHGVQAYDPEQPSKKIPFTLVIPQQKAINYKKALEFAHVHIVQNRLAFQEGPKTTIELIKKLHFLLTDQLYKDNNIRLGEYRRHIKILTDSVGNQSLLERIDKVLWGYERDQFIKLFNELPNKTRSSLTAEDINLLRKVFFVATMPEDVEKEMLTFAEQLGTRLQNGGDFIDHAAFAHAELTRISAFQTGVGRLARIILNAILCYANQPPVIFPNSNGYLLQVQRGTTKPALFTSYIRQQIAWTKTNLPDVVDSYKVHVIQEADYMNPGIQLVNLGRDGCSIQQASFDPTSCSSELMTQKKAMTAGGILAKFASEEAANNKGLIYKFHIDGKPKILHFDINEQKHLNYQEARQLIDLMLLSHPHIFTESTKPVLEFLQKIHYTLMSCVSNEKNPTIGKWRTNWKMIDTMDKFGSLSQRASQKLDAETALKFSLIFSLVKQHPDSLAQLTADQKNLLAQVVYIPPAPENIPVLMTRFVKELKSRLLHKEANYVDIAGWVHTKIVEIFPFETGNGRLARILMNTILRQANQQPVIIYNAAEYLEAVRSTSFTEYLKERLIGWTNRHLTC